MLVVELKRETSSPNKWLFQYPDEYETKSFSGGTWINVVDPSNQSVALHKAEEVLSVYRTEPRKILPVDTRLNYQLLERDKAGRFVGKKK